ncbi:MAG: dTDP-4-dehydrorhamnose 3,5-epimerase family protein [Deltaproteobacteria bacterium]|nr:dTDP-4-dehydrorhamnose 3,5-epimerase family protein [Deltaproteobacteria bacterium]MBI3294152.1 dTDP-4-dehydrorhamnose 3,5-epimerase family protein [Deltaproteobacteria bacterium]
MIHGLTVQPLRTIRDDRGSVLHMLRADSPLFSQFGEAYFSTVREGVVKAWKRHLRMTQHFAIPVGTIRFVFHDDRPHSPTVGKTEEWESGENRYELIRIPPMIWYGFQGIGSGVNLIANITDIPFEEGEVERRPIDHPEIPFQWT